MYNFSPEVTKLGKKKPNLIYIFADGLSYRSVGYNGDIKAKTPNIDVLAQCSVVMDNCVSNHPLSSPYHASLLTGKYSTSTGMVIDGLRINTNHIFLPYILTENGYSTEYIGKWHLYSTKPGKNDSFIPEGPNRLGFNGCFASFYYNNKLNNQSAYYFLDSKEKISVNSYVTDAQTDMAIDRIEKLTEKDNPFALFLSLATPRGPFKKNNVPNDYYEMFKNTHFALPKNYDSMNDSHADPSAKMSSKQRRELNEWNRVYYAMASNIDDNIGKLMQKIVELGIDDNTIIVFTSNCGEMLGAHGRRGSNCFYDEAVRVPFIIRYGEKLTAGKNETCFGTVDIMPTILGVMGINTPDSVQGNDKSFYIFNSKSDDRGQLLMGTGPSDMFGNGKEWRAYRTKQFTYAVYKSDYEEMLFDNLNDPNQSVNLIYDKNYIDIGKRIKDEMYGEMNRIGDTFEDNIYFKKHWIKNKKIVAEL